MHLSVYQSGEHGNTGGGMFGANTGGGLFGGGANTGGGLFGGGTLLSIFYDSL